MSTSGYESYTVCFFLLDDVTCCHISNAFMTSLILIKGSSHETLAVPQAKACIGLFLMNKN